MSGIVDRYRQAVGEAETVVQTGLRLAAEAQGRPASGREAEIAALIYPKLLLHARAALSLAPAPVLPGPGGEVWDISSMAALARALIESYYMMFYVAVDRVPDDIREFRWLLWDYHCASRTLEMARLAGAERHDLADAEAAVAALQTAIDEHPVFLRQTRLVRKSVREGQLCVFSTNTDLSKRAGIDPRYYRTAFMFLSSYVHAHAFSIQQLSAFKSGTEEGLRLVTAVVDYCTAYVCLAVRDYAALLPASPALEGDAAAVVRRWTAMVGEFGRVSGTDLRA